MALRPPTVFRTGVSAGRHHQANIFLVHKAGFELAYLSVAGLEPAASPHSATRACGACEGSRTLNPCGIRA